jgi:hypothetical protein
MQASAAADTCLCNSWRQLLQQLMSACASSQLAHCQLVVILVCSTADVDFRNRWRKHVDCTNNIGPMTPFQHDSCLAFLAGNQLPQLTTADASNIRQLHWTKRRKIANVLFSRAWFSFFANFSDSSLEPRSQLTNPLLLVTDKPE